MRLTQSSYGPALLGVVPAVCLALLAWATWRTRRHTSVATRAWLLPLYVGLAAPCMWHAMGIGTTDALALTLYSALLLACGVVVLARHEVCELMDARTRTRRLFAALAIAATCTLEFTCNDTFFLMWPWFWAIEIALVLGLMLVLWLVCGRRGIGPALGIALLQALGIAQHYVLEFRGSSILPSDLFAAGTALSVSSGYTYGLSSAMLGGFGAMEIGFVCCALLDAHRTLVHRTLARQGTQRPARAPRRLRDLGLAAAIACAMAALVCVPNYGQVFGADMDYWWSKDWYGRQGFIPSFVYCYQDLDIAPPEGYSATTAKQAASELAQRAQQDAQAQARRKSAQRQFQARMPNIVVIQNETFCDLSVFKNLQNDYQGPEFWNTGLTDALAQGDFAVSVFGGGTCNTEFEFLTGNSLAFIGTAKYPFSMYDLSVTQSLPRQLDALGYATIGMHPNLASNWNRDRAYEDLGFGEALFMEDFEGAERFHTHVSDAATYQKTMELLEAHDEPVFVFDVTMQNHSGYDTGSIPASMLRGYTIDGLSDTDTFQVNEFVACIEESDRALQDLVEELRDFPEPTVVVMYGDHHPWFSTTLNDLLFPNEDPLLHAERIHQTSYVVWANYEVAGTTATASDSAQAGKDKTPARKTTSADLLGTLTLDAIGAPLSEFQQAQLGAMHDILALNANGFMGADGAWHSFDEPGDYANTLNLLELVEYLNFGSKV